MNFHHFNLYRICKSIMVSGATSPLYFMYKRMDGLSQNGEPAFNLADHSSQLAPCWARLSGTRVLSPANRAQSPFLYCSICGILWVSTESDFEKKITWYFYKDTLLYVVWHDMHSEEQHQYWITRKTSDNERFYSFTGQYVHQLSTIVPNKSNRM